ncbi:IMPACT family protein [Methylophilus medardicus]|uniref:YigZ family protein n=1 Tax=Methylophilus medardicus TaxID=2588534 RepID=A0A5B8CW50_9PROT|nr:YigZ family protein [Methylophilus medardicus]QDC45326.1 YigZ family protein [Methylophilus medardicus]QDC50333.1 YigZ family protein [Methylophilus medardicus]QDC54038.1 YigZ family protein [Methylophilus medardicus]
MQTFSQLGQADQTINKSRFIARAKRCEDERELALFLRQFASEHQTAGHLAYAFRLKTVDGIVARFSDAGEPTGTAGKPIMQMLDGQGYVNCCVAVVRYYGGINLGTGGLVRAYGGTAKQAMEQAGSLPFIEMVQLKVSTSYKRVDELTREVQKCHGEILDKHFDEGVHFLLKLPIDAARLIQAKF